MNHIKTLIMKLKKILSIILFINTVIINIPIPSLGESLLAPPAMSEFSGHIHDDSKDVDPINVFELVGLVNSLSEQQSIGVREIKDRIQSALDKIERRSYFKLLRSIIPHLISVFNILTIENQGILDNLHKAEYWKRQLDLNYEDAVRAVELYSLVFNLTKKECSDRADNKMFLFNIVVNRLILIAYADEIIDKVFQLVLDHNPEIIDFGLDDPIDEKAEIFQRAFDSPRMNRDPRSPDISSNEIIRRVQKAFPTEDGQYRLLDPRAIVALEALRWAEARKANVKIPDAFYVVVIREAFRKVAKTFPSFRGIETARRVALQNDGSSGFVVHKIRPLSVRL
ncbi:MAG: hypothetical protein ABII23_01020 [bacterium]